MHLKINCNLPVQRLLPVLLEFQNLVSAEDLLSTVAAKSGENCQLYVFSIQATKMFNYK